MGQEPATTPVQLNSAVSFGEHDQSPRLPEGVLGLDLRLLPAVSSRGPSTALLATGRFSGDMARRYGGRIRSAIHIVAIESESGRLYVATPDRPNSVPISPRTDEEVRAAELEDLAEGVTETRFSLDLPWHLGLPPEGGTYDVLLWIDDVVSPLRTAIIPAVDASQEPGRAPNALELEPRWLEHDPVPADFLPLGPIPWRPPAEGVEPHRLHVLVLGQRSRELSSGTVEIPTRPWGIEVRCALPRAPLLEAGTAGERSFVLAVCASLSSREVITLPPVGSAAVR